MRLGRAVRLSLRALAAHRVRSGLALASVAAGVAGVLLTSAVGKGARAEVRAGLDTGRNLLVIRPAQVKRLVVRERIRGTVRTLRPADAEAISRLELAAVAPAVDGGVRVKAGRGALPAGVLGTVPAYAGVRGLRVQHGRFLNPEDDAAAARVVVLGARVAGRLFPGENAVGREVRLRDLTFEVIGVLAPDGLKADGSDQDGTVFVPIRTALRRLFNANALSAIFLGVDDVHRVQAVAGAVRSLLRERHRLGAGAADDFEIQGQARLAELQQQAIATATLVTSGLAGVSLLLGGAGILALMLLSVKERTGEIGLRMAVGARPRDVLLQFLGEAAALALGGWLLGAVLAAGGGLALARSSPWPMSWPGAAAAGSFAMALVVGLGFGALPARRAARLPPIDALRAS